MRVTRLDWVVLVLAALLALAGARKGLVAGALSLAGLVAGAIIGGRIAPALLASGGQSPYTPLIAVVGAIGGGLLLQAAGAAIGLIASARLRRMAPLRLLDWAGGLAFGAASALVLAWALGVVALQLPAQTRLRRQVQRSLILRRLYSVLPPRELLRVLARFDPFPAITGPFAAVAPPSRSVLRLPGVRAAAPSIVRIVGTACGLGVEGSGWVAAPALVVTAAHVVAGESDTRVQAPGAASALPAEAYAFDGRNDVAVLHVPGLRARPLGLVAARAGTPVAVLGYPLDGPFRATPARIGATVTTIMRDAYGRPGARRVTVFRGSIRHGDSGGPAVDSRGDVQTTAFAARVGGGVGYGVPSTIVRRALAAARRPVSTGDCTAP